MKYFVFFLFLIGFAGIIQISYAEEILMYLENDVRKIHYTGENINSAFFDHDSASVIFDLGENAILNLKVPQVYKIGGSLFVLINGEEVSANITTDDCFYYTSFETKTPEKLEIIFAHWAEATERTDDCETFVVSPLKQVKLGLKAEDIRCNNDLQLIFKATNDHPACVTESTKQKLIERGWTGYDVSATYDYTIKTGGVTYGSQYQISGGTVDEIVYDEDRNSLFVSLDGTKQGYIQIVIQTGLLHHPRELPFNYIVMIDGEEIDFEQLSPVILRIPFEKEDQQIEIVGIIENQ